MNSNDPEFQCITEKNAALEEGLFDVRSVVLYLQHASKNYASFADDPHLVAAMALASRADLRLTKLHEGMGG